MRLVAELVNRLGCAVCGPLTRTVVCMLAALQVQMIPCTTLLHYAWVTAVWNVYFSNKIKLV